METDPLLHAAPMVGGFKVLDPAVLYAKVGQGGMGAVYRGRHISLDCDVAIKVLKPDLADDEQFVARFEREARLAARITSDNVVRVLDVRERDGIHYLVMEFVLGETARERVQRKGPLPESEALAIVIGAARGLTFAHKAGIVHRDIKPENILVAADGAVKLADLGLAKVSSSSGQSLTALTTGVMGTPQYMPPEQWQSPDVSAAADIWSLGATLYYLLAGKSGIEAEVPFNMGVRIRDRDFPRLDEVRADVRPEVTALVAKCTARNPAQRHGDAMELLQALSLLGAVPADVLVDKMTGTGVTRMTVVTPPPQATLARIKLQLRETDGVGEGASAQKPPARRFGMVAAFVIVVVLLSISGLGYSQGWFASLENKTDPKASNRVADVGEQEPTSSAPVDNAAAAREAFDQGMQELPKVAGLEAAVAAFEMALQLDAGFEAAEQKLVLALVNHSKELEAVDLGAAYGRIKRAREVLPNDTSWRAGCERIEASLRVRALAGLSVASPTDGLVLASRTVLVKGRMVAAFRAVRVICEPATVAHGKPFPRAAAATVQVVAGRFATTFEANRDGDYALRVEVEDSNGLFAELPPVVVHVDTTEPVVEVAAPGADAWVGANVRLTGTVGDASAVTVTVANQAAVVAGGTWSIDLELGNGPHELDVVARDAAGLSSRSVHRVRVDADAPIMEVQRPAAMSNQPSLLLRGVVRDATTVQCRLGSDEVALAADGSFEVSVPLPEERSYALELVAIDAAGNRSSQVLTTRADRTAPVLTWEAPASATVVAGKVEITGSVRDENACAVQCNGMDATVEGGQWRVLIDIADGQSLSCLVAAVDEAGNRSEPLVRSLLGKYAVVPLDWADAVPEAGTVSVDGANYPRVVVEKLTGMRMVLIEAGAFEMGSPSNEPERSADEKRNRRVIQKPFWLGQTEVSQWHWRKIMGGNPSEFDRDESHPVDSVSWDDCQAFVAKLNGQSSEPGFRLPSEAEWEYACRAGTTTPFSLGQRITTEQVNYNGNYPYAGAAKGQYRRRTVPTGSLPANAWGLHEMHGNVYEWCQDAYGAYPAAGTEGAATGAGVRVLRGGSWGSSAENCRSSNRYDLAPRFRYDSVGFRLARNL